MMDDGCPGTLRFTLYTVQILRQLPAPEDHKNEVSRAFVPSIGTACGSSKGD